MKDIINRIFTVRERQVMLDMHLAEMYDVETKYLNRAVKRNDQRFPEAFRFQLTEEEYENLRCQTGTSSPGNPLRFQSDTLKKDDESLKTQFAISSTKHGGRRYLPYVFTKQGVQWPFLKELITVLLLP